MNIIVEIRNYDITTRFYLFYYASTTSTTKTQIKCYFIFIPTYFTITFSKIGVIYENEFSKLIFFNLNNFYCDTYLKTTFILCT